MKYVEQMVHVAVWPIAVVCVALIVCGSIIVYAADRARDRAAERERAERDDVGA